MFAYGKLRLLYLIGSLSIEYNEPFLYAQILNKEENMTNGLNMQNCW